MGRLDLRDPARDEDADSGALPSARERALQRDRAARALLALDPYEQIRMNRPPTFHAIEAGAGHPLARENRLLAHRRKLLLNIGIDPDAYEDAA